MVDSVVVKDIGALDRFAGRLRRTKTGLDQARTELRSALGEVSAQWQDRQRDKCAQEIEQLSREIAKFSAAAEQQIAYLTRLANHLRSAPR